ncbi:YceI family protein [Oleomonas cavernae]|uniref:YceI family protein n=1 Tax=Oleomonas cavernae TaxID=2320859 RepID=A0A418WD49_9PROT|nr:YceI family protein [Oleomonas cavernae]RJF87957.1 YceI family protein [Oleomonas cavernae]
MKQYLAGLLLALAVAAPALAKTYSVDYSASTVAFAGTHASGPFTGKFGAWQAEIDFDPASLAPSRLKVSFDPASATTGNAMYDGTLPQADWFDVARFPAATFTSTAIAANADGSYTATGQLTIRDVTREISFPFTLSGLDKAPVKATATFPLDRLAFNLGAKSDPKAEWVGQQIQITIDLVASPNS